MIAKRCDRCKKIYNDSWESNAARLRKNGDKALKVTVEYANGYQTIRKIDLCGDCETALLNELIISEEEET